MQIRSITDDPELRYTQSGAARAGFTVAVSHRTKASGEWQDVTDGFFSVTCWNGLAENVAASLKKGARTLVAGKLIQRSFETDGQKRTTIEIVASHVAPDLTYATATVEKVAKENQRLVARGVISGARLRPGSYFCSPVDIGHRTGVADAEHVRRNTRGTLPTSRLETRLTPRRLHDF